MFGLITSRRMRGIVQRVAVLAVVTLVSACQSVSSNYTGAITQPSTARVIVCHGFDCRNKTVLAFTSEDEQRFDAIMEAGGASAAMERAAVSNAIQYFETRAGTVIGALDAPKSNIAQTGNVGQMDCIDESTNSRSLLLHLEKRGLLRHHKVEWNVSRGVLFDGRYFHSTAVISDRQGKEWAVDSWYEPTGGAPDIMALSEWNRRGVLGAR